MGWAERGGRAGGGGEAGRRQGQGPVEALSSEQARRGGEDHSVAPSQLSAALFWPKDDLSVTARQGGHSKEQQEQKSLSGACPPLPSCSGPWQWGALSGGQGHVRTALSGNAGVRVARPLTAPRNARVRGPGAGAGAADGGPRPRGEPRPPQGSRPREPDPVGTPSASRVRTCEAGRPPPAAAAGPGPPAGKGGSARHLLDCSVRWRTAAVKAPRPCGERAARRKAYSVLGLRSSTTNAVAGSKVLPTWGRVAGGDTETETSASQREEQKVGQREGEGGTGTQERWRSSWPRRQAGREQGRETPSRRDPRAPCPPLACACAGCPVPLCRGRPPGTGART